jgi:hypothetical protein
MTPALGAMIVKPLPLLRPMSSELVAASEPAPLFEIYPIPDHVIVVLSRLKGFQALPQSKVDQNSIASLLTLSN